MHTAGKNIDHSQKRLSLPENFYSAAAACAGAAVFSAHIDRGKLLQCKLIHVQCTKKYPSTGIPCTTVRVFGLKKVIF